MTIIKHLYFVLYATAIFFLAACDHNPKNWKTPNMIQLTPRLQHMFEKTKTICFGRFMVDVPASTIVAWGETDIPLGVSVYPHGLNEVKALAQKFIDELKSEKAIYLNDIPLLISIDSMKQPEGIIVTGYEGFEALRDIKINGYFRLNNDGFIINARPLIDRKDQVIEDIASIARRLRRLEENELPTQPGNCIEYAFLPDKPNMEKEPRSELIRVGFRLKEFPDTHLSIFVHPSNPHASESNTLKWQLERVEKNLQAEDSNHPRLQTIYFRRGVRQIHEWTDGFEALSRSPEQANIHSIHDFGMDFQGVPSDPLKPYADIRMQTGVADNAAGAIKVSLTDEEAIAIWDKITSTIRVRPTDTAAFKAAATAAYSYFPLGELVATGRICPQTGLWEPDEPDNTGDCQRQHIKAGEIMPHVTSFGEPSIWQRFKRKRPSYRTGTIWKLVAYDDMTLSAEIPAQMPMIEQVSEGNVVSNDAVDNKLESKQNEQTLPQKKG